MASTRKLRGLVIRPRLQYSMAAYLMAGAVAIGILLTFTILNSIRTTIGQLEILYKIDADLMDVLQSSLNTSLLMISFVLIGVLALIFYFWIRFSHRILGPTIAFERHIDELCKGNFKSRVRLRKKDELIELQTALNRLAEELEARAGEKAKAE